MFRFCTRLPFVIALVLMIFNTGSTPAMADNMGMAVMGFRSSEDLPVETMQTLNGLLWHKVTSTPGVNAIAEPHLAQMLGAAYAPLAGCADDECMGNVIAASNTSSVIWGLVNRDNRNRYVVSVRLVTASGETDWVDAVSKSGSGPRLTSALDGLNIQPIIDFALADNFEPDNFPSAPIAYQPQQVPAPMPQPAASNPRSIPTSVPMQAKGYLTLTTDPPGASIYYEDGLLGQTPLNRKEMNPGQYQLRMEMPNYQTVETSIMVESYSHTAKEFIMVPHMGQLDIITTPDQAKILIDGADIGPSPVNNLQIPPGPVMVQASLPGYETVSRQVVVQTGRKNMVTLNLQPSSGKLTIVSNPAGATVTIDKRRVGVTPIQDLTIQPGNKQVVVNLKGYDQYTENVTVIPGSQQQVWANLVKTLPPNGHLSINSTPSGAVLWLDGKRLGRTPLKNRLLKAGNYNVKLTMTDYLPLEQVVVVERGGKHDLELVLEKEPLPPGMGLLTLSTVPANSTRIVGGTRFQPNQRIKDYLIAAGTYLVKVSLAGFETEEFLVRVEEGQLTEIQKELGKARPKPANGYLSVNSDPEGAMVVVGDVVLGTTPLDRAEVPVGQHAVSIHMQDFKPETRNVRISKGQVNRLTVQMNSIFPTLRVNTNPVGAVVIMNGQRLGETPGTFTKLREGNHSLIISLSGYKEMTREVTLKNGETTTLNIDLNETPGFLTIRTSPENALVIINGVFAGQSPLTRYELPSGDHNIQVNAPGYLPATGKVSIVSRKNHTLRFNLEEEAVNTAPIQEAPRESYDDQMIDEY